jgi:serine/threonine protein kinase
MSLKAKCELEHVLSIDNNSCLFFSGAYGTVYKARDLNEPGKHVALKKVRIPLNEDGVPVSILREIALVRQLERFQHPKIPM